YLALDELRHGPHVEDSRGVRAAPEDQPRKAERLAHAEAEHLGQLEVVPELHQTLDAEAGVARVRRDVTRVDGADARAAQDVDARGAAAAETNELAEDVCEDADLVRAARAAAGENERGAAWDAGDLRGRGERVHRRRGRRRDRAAMHARSFEPR